MPGRVASVSFLGPCVVIDVVCDGGKSIRVRTPSTGCVVGDRVRVGIPADAVWPIPEADAP